MSIGRYAVKEIYYSLQGEGERTGRPAVFCRFAGCNLWSGHEVDRGQAICNFCDTEFVGTNGPGGGEFESAESLASAIEAAFPEREWPISARACDSRTSGCTQLGPGMNRKSSSISTVIIALENSVRTDQGQLCASKIRAPCHFV